MVFSLFPARSIQPTEPVRYLLGMYLCYVGLVTAPLTSNSLSFIVFSWVKSLSLLICYCCLYPFILLLILPVILYASSLSSPFILQQLRLPRKAYTYLKPSPKSPYIHISLLLLRLSLLLLLPVVISFLSSHLPPPLLSPNSVQGRPIPSNRPQPSPSHLSDRPSYTN